MMKRKISIAIGVLMLLGTLPMWAQPKARAAKEEAKDAKQEMSVRAQTRYPRSKALPEDLIWTREVYRTLDMKKEENGALYYPVEPIGDRMNLFSLIFKLLAQKKIPAYEYLLDGTERLTPDSEIKFKDVLDRFSIYYEQRKLKDRKDSVLVIDNSDVPSAYVLSYFVKEVWYFDQRSSTYGSLITALCPVYHRQDDFSMDPVKLPMFWIDYKDLAPYLTGAMVMASNFNNVANRSMDDFFVSHQYSGDIYKTTNLQNRPLAEYCKTDSAMIKEQKRIEAELVNFEKTLYGSDTLSTVAKPTAKEKSSAKKVDKKNTTGEVAADQQASADQQEATAPAEAKSNSKKKGRDKSTSTSARQGSSKRESAAPKASVRRQRR